MFMWGDTCSVMTAENQKNNVYSPDTANRMLIVKEYFSTDTTRKGKNASLRQAALYVFVKSRYQLLRAMRSSLSHAW